MKASEYLSLPLGECLQIPRYNYRNLTEADTDELKAFAERLATEGQLTPVRIAVLSGQVLKEKLIQNLCQNTNQLLIDGERRLVAMSLLDGEQTMETVAVELIPVNSLQQYLFLQMTFNMDRRNTSFVEDGFGFKRFIENGGSKKDLLGCISFPPDVLSKKAKLKYITERIDLVELVPELHPFLNSGLIRSYKSKPHQGYLILSFPVAHQQALAKEFTEVPNPKTDDGILGFFYKFRVKFTSPPFVIDDAGLGVKALGTGACTGCSYLRTVEEEVWGGDNDTEQVTYCYLSECYVEKCRTQEQRLKEQLKQEKVPFVILGQPSKSWNNLPSEQEYEDGLRKIRYYQVVEQGSCSHILVGIADHDAGETPRGEIVYVCPERSGCVVHHPKKSQEKKLKRTSRLSTDRLKLEKNTRITIALEWTRRLLNADYTAVKDELLSHYLLCSFEYFYRAMDSKKQTAFASLIQIEEDKPFSAWSKSSLEKSFSHYDKEKAWISLLLSHLIHDISPSWDLIAKWGEKAKVDFAKTLETALEGNLEALGKQHTKRKSGWTKEQEGLKKKAYALYFDFPIHLGITDWENEQAILELLKDEPTGRKACRMLGAKLGRDEEYVPAQILEKLKGRKAELEAIFPKYKLKKKESVFLETFLAIPTTSLSQLIPEAIQFGNGMANNFIKKCIDLASSDGENLALTEFLTATIRNNTVVLLLHHRSTAAVIKKVVKAEKLTGYYTFDREKRKYTFTEGE